MFGIFVLSVYSLFLIPFTLYRICGASEEEEGAQPWQASGDGAPLPAGALIRQHRRLSIRGPNRRARRSRPS